MLTAIGRKGALMVQSQHDLILKAGRVFCRETGLDGPGMIAIDGDRITASGTLITSDSKKTLEFPEDLLIPGFVDMHAHPAPSHWKYGIDPDTQILPRGSTTVLSQGDAGPLTWDDYLRQIIYGSRIRIRMAISPASYGESTEEAVFQNLEDINVDASVKVIETGEEHIWGIAVNLSSAATGSTDAREIMHRTMIIAERANCPILFGPRRDPFDWPLAEQLDLLRPGDVVTYCFHRDGRLLGNNGRIMDGVQRARDRGVLFDVGHGMASFDFGVAETAVAQGFLPDTISTDVYKRHLGINPTHDMPLMVSKLMAAGVSEREAFTRGTATAARALDLAGEVGTLAPGASADVAVLHWNPEFGLLSDVNGVTRRGGCWEPVLTIRGGQVVKP